MSVKEYTSTKKVEYDFGDTDEDILKKCVRDVEGMCNVEGFVLPGSLEIEGRSYPVNMVGNARMNTHVRYKCKVGVIGNGDIVDVQVKRITKGVGALANVYVNGVDIANVIIPNDIQEAGKTASENEILKVKILTRSFALGWDMIRAVGKII
jgi:hypothetical protein